MTQKNSFARSINKSTLFFNIALGAGIALAAILLFVVGAETQPHWPELWRIRPLIITPLAGAFGGGLAYLGRHLVQQAGMNRLVALVLSIIGYFIVLWLGIVLGLDGTMWN